MTPHRYASGLMILEGDAVFYFTSDHQWEAATICRIFLKEENSDSLYRFTDSNWVIIAANFQTQKIFYLPEEDSFSFSPYLVLAYRGLLPATVSRTSCAEFIYHSNPSLAFQQSPLKDVKLEEMEKLPGVEHFFDEYPKVPVYTSGIIVRNGDIVILPDYNFSFAVIQDLGRSDWLKCMAFRSFNDRQDCYHSFSDNIFVIDFDEPVFYARSSLHLSKSDYLETARFDEWLRRKMKSSNSDK